MDSWMDTVTSWADKALTAVIDKKVNNPHELQKMQLAYYGDYGMGFGNPAMNGGFQTQTGGVNRNMLLIGAGALLLFMLVKD